VISIFISIIVLVVLFIILGLEDNQYDKVFKFKPKCLLSLFALLIILFGGIKIVKTGHTGVVTTFGKVEDYTLEAGLHFVNPLSTVISMDNRTQTEEIEINAFSSDIQEVRIIYSVNYSIDKTNAQKIYREIGANYFNAVRPKIIECVKTVIAEYTAESLVGARTDAALKIEAALAEALTKYHVNLIGTSLQDIDFTDEFTDAVEAKQVAEQEKLKAQTEAETQIIKARADAEVKLIEAESTAKANELLTEALTDKILKKQAIEKWDGKLPTIVSEGSSLLELTGLFN